MRELPDECETFLESRKDFVKKRELAEWYDADFIDALCLWAKFKKSGPAWGPRWLDAPCHLFEILEEFDRVFDQVNAPKVIGGQHGRNR